MKRILSAVGLSLLALTANAAEPATGAEARAAQERAQEQYVRAFIHGGNLRAYRLARSGQQEAAVRDQPSAGASR